MRKLKFSETFEDSYKRFYIIEVVYLAYNLIKSPEIQQNLKKWQHFSVKLKKCDRKHNNFSKTQGIFSKTQGIY